MITISIVDDEKELCQSIATFVNGAPGFRCVSMYHSGEAALEHLPQDRPDVVLMDINMGGISGIECAGRLKALMPQIQIMMLTVYEDTDQIFKALSAGASGYMLKRLTPGKLLEAIQDVHGGGSPMSSSIARKVVGSFQRSSPAGAEKVSFTSR
ncbi:MAG TPA: response regulator transcription factor, partial [Verrucomicrobiae bacterium]